MGALIYGDHNLFSPRVLCQQILGLVYQAIHKSQLFRTVHTICCEIGIHCKVPNYLGELLYSCTNIKYTVYIMYHVGKALHTVAKR